MRHIRAFETLKIGSWTMAIILRLAGILCVTAMSIGTLGSGTLGLSPRTGRDQRGARKQSSHESR